MSSRPVRVRYPVAPVADQRGGNLCNPFIYGWTQYLWPLLVTDSNEMNTIAIALKKMISFADAYPLEPCHGDSAAHPCGRDDAAVVREGPCRGGEVNGAYPAE